MSLEMLCLFGFSAVWPVVVYQVFMNKQRAKVANNPPIVTSTPPVDERWLTAKAPLTDDAGPAPATQNLKPMNGIRPQTAENFTIYPVHTDGAEWALIIDKETSVAHFRAGIVTQSFKCGGMRMIDGTEVISGSGAWSGVAIDRKKIDVTINSDIAKLTADFAALEASFVALKVIAENAASVANSARSAASSASGTAADASAVAEKIRSEWFG